MKRYKDFQPTGCDPKGLALPDQQEWLVVPVGRSRDSGVRSESNFEVALRILGGESETVEVHRFGHWGPGWFEIIIVHPSREDEVQEIEDSLENYSLLDDMDYSEREYDRACEVWSRMRLKDRIKACARYHVSIFAARRDEIPEDATGDLLGYLAE